MNSVEFNGTVTSGEGNGKKFLLLPWVKNQIEQKLGFTPYPGTLNVELSQTSIKTKNSLDPKEAVVILPESGFSIGLCFKGFVEHVECAIVLPQIKNYPKNLLEVIAPVSLRKTLNLKDGDKITVKI